MSDLTLYGTGRRKRSVARVFLKTGNGEILINGKHYKDYLCRESLATIVTQPLALLELKKSYDISRALNTVNDDYRKIIKEKGFLTRDARKVERKKPGQPGARKNFQFSKR